jgi:succinate dehydrogenase / fumarate reductase flavoprotein subunit
MQWEATLRQLENTQERGFFANPCYTQIHPTCIPVSGDHQSKLTLMSESLRNDRIWVPAKLEDAQAFEMGRKTNRII